MLAAVLELIQNIEYQLEDVDENEGAQHLGQLEEL